MIKKVTGYRLQVTVKIIPVFFVALFLFLYTVPYSLSPVYAQQATLSISPSTGTYNRNCSFALDVNINTAGGQTDGTDAIVIYDPSRFSATSITNGTVYPEYPGNNIDEVNGKITISGLASVSSAFSGQGKLATINFTVKDKATTGATQVTIDFDAQNKTKTTDSNVVQRGTIADILNSVVNGNFTVGEGTCGASPAPVGVRPPQGAPEEATPPAEVKQPYQQPYQPKTLNNTANTELTYTIAIIGSSLVILGVLGLVLL